MKNYSLVKKNSHSIYAELSISSKIISSATEIELIYKEIAEWVKDLTSGDIIPKMEDFEVIEGILLMELLEGKNYVAISSISIDEKEMLIKILRKENPYKIVFIKPQL